ncbi:hypothetical protein GT044_35925, partial [Streptomyces sp. SID335]|nr:hypothetical protein [Streptomyces sp. SID335]
MGHDEDDDQTTVLRTDAAPGATPGGEAAARRDRAVRAAVEQGVVGPAAPV